jgi:hypothetical protein
LAAIRAERSAGKICGLYLAEKAVCLVPGAIFASPPIAKGADLQAF